LAALAGCCPGFGLTLHSPGHFGLSAFQGDKGTKDSMYAGRFYGNYPKPFLLDTFEAYLDNSRHFAALLASRPCVRVECRPICEDFGFDTVFHVDGVNHAAANC